MDASGKNLKQNRIVGQKDLKGEAMDVSENVDKSKQLVDDDDDDVVIMKEEKIVPSGNKETINSISKVLDGAKEIVNVADAEIEVLKQELKNMQASISESVFESLRFLIDNPKSVVSLPVNIKTLEKMIDTVLASLPIEEMVDLTKEEYETYDDKLHFIEKANQAVSKLFLDCHSRLKEFKQSLITETAEVDKEIEEIEKNMDQACVLIESDEDDDVTIVTPLGDLKSSPGQPAQPVEQQAKLPGGQAGAAVPNRNQALAGARSLAQSGKSPNSQSMPSMEQVRSQFTNAVNKANSQSQQVPETIQPPKPANTSRWAELKVQDKVLGKKFNDVWYPGTILDVYPASQDDKQEWRCKVKFDGKGMKTLPGRHIAYKEPINCFLRVGTRVVALYKEDDAPNTFFAGVVAEAPSIKNTRRFLVFFDDGYAQYCEAKELHKVYMQSENVWEDINIETSAFIKEYLRIYPERPMVRLSKGQVVRTEWNGKWWTAKVQDTDSSLVKMYFQADKRTEWLYRGSTRLEPLFKALANADAIKAAGSARGRRHNMRPSDLKKPSVEYTRGAAEDDSNSSSSSSANRSRSTTRQTDNTKKKSNVAKKSTGGVASASSGGEGSKSGQWEAPWLRYQRKAAPGSQRSRSTDSSPLESAKDKNQAGGEGKSSKDIASILQERLATTNTEVEYDEENATGERKDMKLETQDIVRKEFKYHACSSACVGDHNDVDKFKGYSSLTIPLLCGWERQVSKTRPSTKRHVIYRTPCGWRLRNIKEVDRYLLVTNSNLTIDLFCFDQQLHVNTEFVPVKTFCDIKDLSYGKENYPISCVNGIDRQYPDYVEYSDHRIPSVGVKLNLDPDYLVCCDCTDNCRDRSKCACQQMTIENTTWIGEKDLEAGYEHRRLKEPLFTGIVECNMRCKCDKRCVNRVAQHGLQMRLQVFKTGKKGWGLRCLDDIAKGSFICIYAGQLLTDKGANEDGKQYGDEYLAELDFIEVVEMQKEGYESDVDMDFSDDETDANYKVSKDSEQDSDYTQNSSPPEASRRKLRRRKTDEPSTVDAKEKEEEIKKKPESDTDAATSNVDYVAISISDDDEDDEETGDSTMDTGKPSEEAVKQKLKARAKKSTGGSRFNLSTTFMSSLEPVSEKGPKSDKKERAPTRSFFQDDTDCYIMDAKSMGNLGRYLNHSCTPNVFVQNIFVDTHDLRFPWVAFFAGQYIRAGTELTWDYNYEVGSVPDKVLYCYCGSPMCRGRLL